MKVHLDHVGMAFPTPGGLFRAVAPLELQIGAGRFVSLVGPSGCGKSTLFNIIAGLQHPTEGRVLIDGEDATGAIGRVGYMLQKDLLLPWRTVLDNVILGMEIQGLPRRDARSSSTLRSPRAGAILLRCAVRKACRAMRLCWSISPTGPWWANC